jgi:hypothetical protein
MTVFGLEMLFVSEVGQGTEIAAYLENDIPSTASVSPRRAAFGHKFLPSECRAAIAAPARRDFYERFIGKFFHAL